MSVSPSSRLCATRMRGSSECPARRRKLRARAWETTRARVAKRSPILACGLHENTQHALNHERFTETFACRGTRAVAQRAARVTVVEQAGELRAEAGGVARGHDDSVHARFHDLLDASHGRRDHR